MVTRADIERAAELIGPYVRRTPVLDIELPDGRPVTLKLECLQHTGSFKTRGAFGRMLSAQVPPAGVIAASGGNHGLGVAYAAGRLGVRAEVFVPEISAPVKVDRLRRLGAIVTQTGDRYAAALAAARERVAATGALEIHAYDQPEVQAGQGTLGREFEAQAPDLDTILVAVGGGGLLGGLPAWYGDRVRLVAVEPRLIPTLAAALDAGEPVDVDVAGVAADSLGATRISAATLTAARANGVRSVLVEDADIVAARLLLWNEARVVAEPGGATALAALTSGAYRPEPGERVGVIVCGANTNPADLVR